MEHKYKDVTIEGSTFKDAPYDYDVKITFSNEMISEYIPELEKVLANEPRGLRLLLIAMTNKEGFKKGSTSYITNNPGNIENMDNGSTKKLPTLKDGILLQKDYVEKVISGKYPAYPMGKEKVIKPYYSKEIANNPKTYAGRSPYAPGYRFVFTGQLDQYVKIYSVGARSGNNYINAIISFFKNHNIHITPESKIQDIIKIK